MQLAVDMLDKNLRQTLVVVKKNRIIISIIVVLLAFVGTKTILNNKVNNTSNSKSAVHIKSIDSKDLKPILTTTTNIMAPKTATFVTSMGTFKAELFTDQMPITCGNFIDLANNGFYDGLHFHRVIPGVCILL